MSSGGEAILAGCPLCSLVSEKYAVVLMLIADAANNS